MKKLILILLIFLFSISIVGCNSNETTEKIEDDGEEIFESVEEQFIGTWEGTQMSQEEGTPTTIKIEFKFNNNGTFTQTETYDTPDSFGEFVHEFSGDYSVESDNQLLLITQYFNGMTEEAFIQQNNDLTDQEIADFDAYFDNIIFYYSFSGSDILRLEGYDYPIELHRVDIY